MSGWVKVTEEWFERPDVEEAGAETVMFHLSALAYSSRHLTNGVIPPHALRRLWPVDDPHATADRLVTLGWWQATEDGRWVAVDWRDHILADDEVAHRREQDRIRQERKRRHNADDHSLCDRCSVVRSGRHGVTHGVSHNVNHAPPNLSAPNLSAPTRPREGGEERTGAGDGARSAGATRAPRREEWDTTRHALSPFAHPFIDDGNGTCAEMRSGETCGLPASNRAHGHEFVFDGATVHCDYCGQDRDHSAHQLRQDSDECMAPGCPNQPRRACRTCPDHMEMESAA